MGIFRHTTPSPMRHFFNLALLQGLLFSPVAVGLANDYDKLLCHFFVTSWAEPQRMDFLLSSQRPHAGFRRWVAVYKKRSIRRGMAYQRACARMPGGPQRINCDKHNTGLKMAAWLYSLQQAMGGVRWQSTLAGKLEAETLRRYPRAAQIRQQMRRLQWQACVRYFRTFYSNAGNAVPAGPVYSSAGCRNRVSCSASSIRHASRVSGCRFHPGPAVGRFFSSVRPTGS